jgi:purine-nucleoside phosphorylase
MRRTLCLIAASSMVTLVAAGAARAIARLTPRLLLFVGTAGSYADAPVVGGVVIARRIHLASTAVLRGDGYLPRPMVTTAVADPRLQRALLRAAVATAGDGGAAAALLVDVATPLGITRTAGLARRLSHATGAIVENLELFAVARAAAAVGVPFGAVLGISNRVGPRAHTEWLRHQTRATTAASRVVEAYLSVNLVADLAANLASRPRGRPRTLP